MKKRLASLLLATAFVFVAGAAFAAWNHTVPAAGDFFVLSGDATNGAEVTLSGDLKASGYTSADNSFSFAMVSVDSDMKNSGDLRMGATTLPKSGDVSDDMGVSDDYFIVLRSTESTLEVPVNFWGYDTTSIDAVGGVDVKYEVSFDKATGENAAVVTSVSSDFTVTSADVSGDAVKFKTGNLTFTVSPDTFFGVVSAGALNISFDATMSSSDETSKDNGQAKIGLYYARLKEGAAVKVTYTVSGDKDPEVIVLKKGENKFVLPVAYETGNVTSASILKIENVGTEPLTLAGDYNLRSGYIGKEGVSVDSTLPSGVAVSKDVSINNVDTKTLLGGTYKLSISWGGSIKEGTSADMMGTTVTSYVNSNDADFGLSGFEVKSTDLDGKKLGDKTIKFPKNALASMDFTSKSASVFTKYNKKLSEGVAAVGFSLTASSKDFDAFFDSGKEILMVKVDVEFLVNSADATKNNKPLTSKDWKTMVGATDNASRRDLFLSKVKIFKAYGGDKVADIVDVLEKHDSNVILDGFITVEKSSDNDVEVKIKNLFLADGGTAGLKVETIDGKKVLVFYDGVADGYFKDPIGIAGTLVKPVTPVTPDPSDPTDPTDPADPVKKPVTINTGVYKIYIGDEIPGNEVSGVTFTLTRLGDVASSNKGQTVYGPYKVENGTFSVPEIPSGRYSLQLSELKGYITPAPVVFSTSGAVNGLVAVLSKNISYVEGGYLTLSVKDATENASFDGEVKFTLKDKDEKEVSILVGENALPRGDYTITATTTDVAFTVALDKASFTIDDDENYKVAVKATVNAAGGSSSGGGCNVGFAPLALLLLAPVMFLKK